MKMDVISVLGNAIDYVKLLQERVEFLEEQIRNKPSSAPELFEPSMGEISSPTSTMSSESTSYSPEIEVRVADRVVFVKVQCLMHKGVLVKVLDTMEKFDLFITNVNSMSFGPMLDMTIVAQMEDGCCLKSEDLVKNIKTSLHLFY